MTLKKLNKHIRYYFLNTTHAVLYVALCLSNFPWLIARLTEDEVDLLYEKVCSKNFTKIEMDFKRNNTSS